MNVTYYDQLCIASTIRNPPHNTHAFSVNLVMHYQMPEAVCYYFQALLDCWLRESMWGGNGGASVFAVAYRRFAGTLMPDLVRLLARRLGV